MKYKVVGFIFESLKSSSRISLQGIPFTLSKYQLALALNSLSLISVPLGGYLAKSKGTLWVSRRPGNLRSVSPAPTVAVCVNGVTPVLHVV